MKFILRLLFSALAPQEPPAWFVGDPPIYDGPSFPSRQGLNDIEDKAVGNWLADPVYDLTGNLKWFQEAVEAFHDAKAAHKKDCVIARYFQWRWWYAEQMLEARP